MSQLFARSYDFFMGPLEKRKFNQIRRELISEVSGTVLEIGSGTGINFPFYKKANKVMAIEPSRYMIEQSMSKLKKASVSVEVLQASAEELPFPDDSFDSVVATLVFCTIPNPEKALLEIKRVCKPSGKIILFEHVKMENRFLGSLQEWLTPAWKKLCDGCCLNRDTLGLLEEHGLELLHVQYYYKKLFVSVQAKNERAEM